MNYEIITWKDIYSKDYISLSLEWLNKYVAVEAHDLETIEHPYENVLNKDGMIWFAVSDNKAVGTISMIKIDGSSYELAKLSVTENFKGYGIGNALVKTAVDFAKEKKIKKIILYTNSILKAAIHTYSNFGFKEVEMENNEYETADVMMQLILK